MKLEVFRQNIGRTFKFRPIPRRDTQEGSWESELNLWILLGETPDKKGFTFLNAIGNHHPFVLEHIYIRNFDAPDILLLRGQVVLKDETVFFEPFLPRPASAPITRLSLFLNNEEETATVEICPPITGPMEFSVVNRGEQTVRDFRNTIFVPKAFHESPSQPIQGKLIRDNEVTVNGHEYTTYTNLISEPIFKDDRVRIGTLSLQADRGEYIFLWQVRCDNGVFPTEKDLGRISVKVVTLGDLVKNNFDALHGQSTEP